MFLDLSLDWRMLAFTMSVAVTTAVLFGTFPALTATRVQPNETIGTLAGWLPARRCGTNRSGDSVEGRTARL